MHYGVVIDKDNAKTSKIVMVIPFKSLDDGETEADIDTKTEVYLGNKVFEIKIDRQKQKLSKME